MEKGRHPHVVRTWTVERTRIPYRPPQVVKPGSNPRQDLLRGPSRNIGPKPPVTGPKTDK